MSFAAIQLNENLIACVQMKDDTVTGVVVTLVLVLGDGAGPDLEDKKKNQNTDEPNDAHFFLI